MANTIEKVQLKRGPSNNVVGAPLERGEPAFALDKKELWVGDGTGKIKITDIYFYNSFSNFPATGEEDKLYIAKDTGSFYIWDSPSYKKYEFDFDDSVIHCRIRSNTPVTFPSSFQDLQLIINDGESDPTKLHQDVSNLARIVIEDEGWYCIKSKILFRIQSSTGGYTTIDTRVSSRVLIDDTLFIPASEDSNEYDMYYVNNRIVDSLECDFIYYFTAGQFITLQIEETYNPSYPHPATTETAKLEVYKFGAMKGEKGDPGNPGSLWHNGSGVPLLTVGNNNDYYLDNDTGDVYFKSSDTWSVISNLASGPPGPEGPPGPLSLIHI